MARARAVEETRVEAAEEEAAARGTASRVEVTREAEEREKARVRAAAALREDNRVERDNSSNSTKVVIIKAEVAAVDSGLGSVLAWVPDL